MEPTGMTADDVVKRMLEMKKIAVVGASQDANRPSHFITKFLIDKGYDVTPVNPQVSQLFGRSCYPSLAKMPADELELVNVFRRADACPEVVREAVRLGAKGVWLQSGIFSAESRKIAEAAGVLYVENRCIMVEASL